MDATTDGAGVPVIEVEHLHKRYHDVTAVEDVSFAVQAGEIFGIVGPNGAGKTTTVECIEGLRRRDGGSITVHGFDPVHDRDRVREILGAQLQESLLQDKIKVGEALDLYASFYRHPVDWHELADRLGLSGKLSAAFDQLSGGQKQRLSVALALVGDPKVAVLDELTTGLDPSARRGVWSLVTDIRDRGVTVLLVTHFMEEAERLCDRVAVIDGGRVVAIDTPAGLAAATSAGQHIRFRLPTGSAEFDPQQLDTLVDVAAVRVAGDRVEVHGNDNALTAVTSMLARRNVVVADLRVEQTNLDDAFVALTNHHQPAVQAADESAAREEAI